MKIISVPKKIRPRKKNGSNYDCQIILLNELIKKVASLKYVIFLNKLLF